MRIKGTHAWLLPGNQTTAQTPRSCRCAPCVFCLLFNQLVTDAAGDDAALKLKTGCLDFPRARRRLLPPPTCVLQQCLTGVSCILRQHSIASRIITYSHAVHVTGLTLESQTMRTLLLPSDLRCPRSPGSQQGSRIHLMMTLVAATVPLVYLEQEHSATATLLAFSPQHASQEQMSQLRACRSLFGLDKRSGAPGARGRAAQSIASLRSPREMMVEQSCCRCRTSHVRVASSLDRCMI
ncbi:hypothetical protein ACQKWADRAFT_139065 [Trichoderma austrokoningii]